MSGNPLLYPQEGCEAAGGDLGCVRVGGDEGRGGEEGADAGGGADQGKAARGDGEGVEGRQGRRLIRQSRIEPAEFAVCRKEYSIVNRLLSHCIYVKLDLLQYPSPHIPMKSEVWSVIKLICL